SSKEGRRRRVTSWPRSTPASPRGSPPPTSKPRRRCSSPRPSPRRFPRGGNSSVRGGAKPRRSPDRLTGVDTLLETRSPSGSPLGHRLRRWRSAALPIAQAATAAGLSWLIAVHIVGHRVPFFAPVAAVLCLRLSLGQR